MDRALREAVAGRAHRDARWQAGRHGTREPHRDQRYQPVLANLFMHYAFDKWLEREFPAVEFERYADDAVVHCATERQAREVLAALEQRMAEVGLQLHPDKTRIVYCKDGKRRAHGLRGHVVHLPGLHVPRQERPDQGRDAACSPGSCPRSARTPSRE